MDIACFLQPGWDPMISPAAPTREWMDGTAHKFAYRCLPLSIANSYGWSIASPCTFDAWWQGGIDTRHVLIDIKDGFDPHLGPASVFGNGVLTFHVSGIFRTPPGWAIYLGGPPNQDKPGIAPLTGIVETDWSPYTASMNWRFNARNKRIRFQKGEPICQFFPVRLDALEECDPKLVPIETDPELQRQTNEWSRSRDAFHELIRTNPPPNTSDHWQKRYYRGIDMNDAKVNPEHRVKLKVKNFTPGETSLPKTGTILQGDACPFYTGAIADPGPDINRPDTPSMPAPPSDVRVSGSQWAELRALAARLRADPNDERDQDPGPAMAASRLAGLLDRIEAQSGIVGVLSPDREDQRPARQGQTGIGSATASTD